MEFYNEFDTSLKKALSDIEKDYLKYDALVICGTHNPKNWEEQIQKIKEARDNGRPFLGICFGHQLACIEYARNVLGIKDATSEELGKGTYVVKKRKGLRVGVHEGESYWHNYEPDIIWHTPDNFITTQYHPEYQSYPDKPHPILIKFINLCKKNHGITGGRQL